ncbi:MAG: hypothetical protein HY535_04690 [Chloroflexi bacterium]|nr:hypothetical protein [Chloroflexota bacterium]
MRRLARWAEVPGAHPRPALSWRVPCGTPMLLALMLWVCSLLLVMILVAPFFGLRVASIVGLGLLVFFVLSCRAICAVRVDPGKE